MSNGPLHLSQIGNCRLPIQATPFEKVIFVLSSDAIIVKRCYHPLTKNITSKE